MEQRANRHPDGRAIVIESNGSCDRCTPLQANINGSRYPGLDVDTGDAVQKLLLQRRIWFAELLQRRSHRGVRR